MEIAQGEKWVRWAIVDGQGEYEEPEIRHRRTDEDGEDSRDLHRVGVCRTLLTRSEREVQMQVQVDVPVLLPMFTALLLLRFKTLMLASRLIT